MDKYTVDLDKVLNDFEYSELTEQNNSSTFKQYSINQNYPKAQITTTKHSINNVFHSLNEYLSTDIKSDFSKASSSLSETNEIESLPSLIRKNSKDKIDISSIQNIFKTVTDEDRMTPEDQVTAEETVEDCEANETDNNNVITKTNLNDELKEDIEITVEETSITQPKIVNFEDLEISDTEIEEELIELEKEYEDKFDNKNEETAQNEEHEEKSESEDISSKMQEYNETIESNLSTVTISVETIEDREENEKITETQEQQLFEKVEDENKNDETICINEPEIQTNENTNEKLEVEEKIVESQERRPSILRPNSLDLESTSDNLTINLIGAPGSTPYNNHYTNSAPTPHTFPTSSPVRDLNPEPEITTSLSPTISESSTYNSDSPNTSDSCNDTSLEEFSKQESVAKAEGGAATEGVSTSTNGRGLQPDDCSGNNDDDSFRKWLGKVAPFWTPDSDALSCLHCSQKFTVIKRRHHCRACGLVLCSKCCNMKCKLRYLENSEARVCTKCYEILQKEPQIATTSSGSDNSPDRDQDSLQSPSGGQAPPRLNPNNPMEYCSTVPPLQQVVGMPAQPPTVMVPVGVLKRKGSTKSRQSKSVMFCDGIRPGCDLTELDRDFNYKDDSVTPQTGPVLRSNKNLPKIDPSTGSYIPKDGDNLPPVVTVVKSDTFYADCTNNLSLIETLKSQTTTFAIQRNLLVNLKIISMDCCINKMAWCFSTEGMIVVGQDELIILLEFIDNEKTVPKDVFLHLNNVYNEAVKGTSIPELGLSIHPTSNFLESKNHAGFLYIKPTFQCVQNVLLPKEPYLIGVLIHRWETPWAKIFPLRLLLRLGAEYRYYPSPIISTRHRESVYVEIGHTIINLLADFRNFSYTIPTVRGLTIHMEEKNTTVSIPINRYDQVMKALNNSSDHILAFAANFSPNADSHLVCIQDTHGNNENAYTTHAINIHNKPRKVTGASFIVLNGALKSTSGLTAKSSIVEDGLMVQIPAEHMLKLRAALRAMKNHRIPCGCVNTISDEFVNINWVENDVNFNVGVLSPIDGMALSGIPSIRVHNGKDFVCNSGTKMIRWSEVFIIQSGEETSRTQDPIDISKISENISKATSQALVKFLELLATNSCSKIGIRTTLHVDNVSYLAGSNGTKLPPIYMKSLDNELIPVLHRISASFNDRSSVVLELMFHILNF